MWLIISVGKWPPPSTSGPAGEPSASAFHTCACLIIICASGQLPPSSNLLTCQTPASHGEQNQPNFLQIPNFSPGLIELPASLASLRPWWQSTQIQPYTPVFPSDWHRGKLTAMGITPHSLLFPLTKATNLLKIVLLRFLISRMDSGMSGHSFPRVNVGVSKAMQHSHWSTWAL